MGEPVTIKPGQVWRGKRYDLRTVRIETVDPEDNGFVHVAGITGDQGIPTNGRRSRMRKATLLTTYRLENADG